MNERVFISFLNGIILLLILLVQILIPYISRRNILLGIKIPTEALNTKEVKSLIKGFVKTNIYIGLISLIIISYFVYRYYSIILLTLSPLIFLLILFIIHIIWNKKLKTIKVEMEWGKLASNVVVVDTKFSRDKLKGIGPSKWWLLLPLIIIIFNMVLSLVKYPYLPERIATHWDFQGNVDGYMNKSIFTALMMPGFQLLMGVIMYLAYYAMVKSKQEIDSGNPEISLEKNLIFRRAWGFYFLFSTILLELFLTITNMMILGMIEDMKLFNIIGIIITFIIIGGSIILSLVLGQGGDRLKTYDDKSKGYDIDDDKLWKLGNYIYYNPEDPSLFVEKRVGVGWTVNGGRPLGLVLLILPFIIIIVSLFLIK